MADTQRDGRDGRTNGGSADRPDRARATFDRASTQSDQIELANLWQTAVGRRRSPPLGRYWRSRPLVFSLVPRCQGPTGVPRHTQQPHQVLWSGY